MMINHFVFVFLLVCFASFSTAAEPNCTFGAATPCSFKDTITLEGGGKQIFTIHTPVNALFSYSFEIPLGTCFRLYCWVTSLLLDAEDYQSFQSGNLDLGSLDGQPGCEFNTSSADIEVAWPLKVDNPQNYYMVFLNPTNEPIQVSLELTYTPDAFKSCFGALIGVATSGVGILLAIIIIAVVYNKRKNGAYASQQEGPEIIEYPYVKPEPIECLANSKITIPFLKQRTVSFSIYWCQNDDVMWIWKPIVGEVLTKTQRIIISISFLLLQLLIQTFWASALAARAARAEDSVVQATSGVSPVVSHWLGMLIVKVISVSAIITIIGAIYKPFMRMIAQPVPLWSDSESKNKQLCGRILRYSGIAVLVGIVVALIASFVDLLEEYTCRDFWGNIFLPFFATLFWHTIISGTIVRFITYKLHNTFGKPPDDASHKGLLASQSKV